MYILLKSSQNLSYIYILNILQILSTEFYSKDLLIFYISILLALIYCCQTLIVILIWRNVMM